MATISGSFLLKLEVKQSFSNKRIQNIISLQVSEEVTENRAKLGGGEVVKAEDNL